MTVVQTTAFEGLNQVSPFHVGALVHVAGLGFLRSVVSVTNFYNNN